MFNLTFSPTRRDDALTLSAAGDTLTINGAALDLSALPEGATLPQATVACEWLASDIERRDGVIHLTLVLPLGPDAPEVARFPEPIIVTTDGPIALPTDTEETPA